MLLVRMTVLFVGLVLTLILNALTMEGLERAFHAPALLRHHFRPPLTLRATTGEKRRLFVVNTAISLVVLFGCAGPLYRHFFTTRQTPLWTILWQALAILALYDGTYYALHRFVFHHPKLMRFVHGLHHRARTPSARESLYVHPIELSAGISLFMLSVWVVGPVHVAAFLLANVIYSQLNILIHSSIEFPSAPMRLFNLWARKHHGHHGVDMNKNFGSVSPLWDMLLGTSIL